MARVVLSPNSLEQAIEIVFVAFFKCNQSSNFLNSQDPGENHRKTSINLELLPRLDVQPKSQNDL